MNTETEIKDILETAHLPGVQDWRVSLGTDSTGDPAAYIIVVMADEEAQRADFIANAQDIERRIFDEFQSKNIDPWPYVRFRSQSEMAAE
ncbi:MAG: hypothetical protein HYV27_05080 [Candidatus Hydrogenedentes bacterium]|nr:hypothetical protein [Candidatus Hydrogenedentota bacterium]